MAKLVKQTMYVSELTPEMIAEGWERSENQSKQPNQLIMKEEDVSEFLDFTITARNELCAYINLLPWQTGLRTRIETFLICFDQLKERYAKSAIKEQVDWDEAWKIYYGTLDNSIHSNFVSYLKENYSLIPKPKPCATNTENKD